MIAEFNYNGKDRKLCVLKISTETIEGFELNDFKNETPEEIEELVKDFSQVNFEDLPFTFEADSEDPNYVLRSYLAPRENKYTKYFSHYRKFPINKTGLELKLRVPFDKEKLNKLSNEVNEIYKDLTKNESTEQAEKTLNEEEGLITVQYIESKDSKEMVMKLTTRKGTSFYYAPQGKDEFGFSQFLKAFPSLISFIYSLGKNNIPLTIRESQIVE